MVPPPRWFSIRLLTIERWLVVVCLLLGATSLAAQASPAPERVIHLWVDPMYGSDAPAAALQWNPPSLSVNCSTCPEPCRSWPVDIVDPSQSNALLLHAPWPFKTVTAAVAWIRGLAPPGTSPLPYTSPHTGAIWRYAIIHLMPGVYSQSTKQHLDNGIRGNGETFPIRLPDGVSVQGTSALNTLFDLATADPPSPAFEFGVFVNGTEAITGTNVFVDAVSIASANGSDGRKSCGIRIEDDVAAHPTITNCFFFNNRVGVVVIATRDASVVHDGTRLANNTFAWNRIGLWNGQTFGATAVVGVSELVLLNNIFDPGHHTTYPLSYCSPKPKSWSPAIAGASPFEGVPSADMEIAPGGSARNYNAFPTNPPYNQGIPIVAGLNATTLRAGTTTPAPAPGRDITPIIGLPAQQPKPKLRGILYVRDLLCNGGTVFTTRSNWDRSQHDLRLSPAWVPADASIHAPGDPKGSGSWGALNLLVDNGWAGSFPVSFANGQTLTHEPGFLPLGTSQSTWPYHSWVFDAEGYGNPRIHDDPLVAGGGVGHIDIGADELGELIVAGTVYGTTMFLDDAARGNRDQWFLGPPQVIAGKPPTPVAVAAFRPIHYLPPLVNYQASATQSLTWWSDWNFAPNPPSTGPYYLPTIADVTPHLEPDVHPWWHQTLAPYPSNPLWEYCLGGYNSLLYIDPLAKIANPPGTYRQANTPAYEWIDESAAPGAFPNYGMFPFVDHFDTWCRGVDLPSSGSNRNTFPWTYDHPAEKPRLVRFSIETDKTTWGSSSTGRNVQSFGVLVKKEAQ